MNFFDRLYGILFQPVETLKEIVRKKPFWQAVMVIIITGLLPTATQDYGATRNILQNDQSLPYLMPDLSKMLPVFITMGIVGSILLKPLWYFLVTAVYHLIAEFMDSKMFKKDVPELTLKEIAEDNPDSIKTDESEGDIIGTGKGLYSALAFASLPMIFLTITNLIIRFTGWKINWIFSLIFWIWTIVLEIIGIRENYKMNGGNAALTYFLPVIAIIIIFIIMLIFMGASMVSFITSIIRDVPWGE